MTLNNGKTLPSLTEDDNIIMRHRSEARSRQREGMDGISRRDIQDKITDGLVANGAIMNRATPSRSKASFAPSAGTGTTNDNERPAKYTNEPECCRLQSNEFMGCAHSCLGRSTARPMSDCKWLWN